MYLVLQIFVIVLTFFFMTFKKNKFITLFNSILKRILKIINYLFFIVNILSIILILISKQNIDIFFIVVTVVQALITILLMIIDKTKNSIKNKDVLNIITMSTLSFVTIYVSSLIIFR